MPSLLLFNPLEFEHPILGVGFFERSLRLLGNVLQDQPCLLFGVVVRVVLRIHGDNLVIKVGQMIGHLLLERLPVLGVYCFCGLARDR